MNLWLLFTLVALVAVAYLMTRWWRIGGGRQLLLSLPLQSWPDFRKWEQRNEFQLDEAAALSFIAKLEIGRRGRSGGVVSRHLDDLDAVLESDALDDFRQLVFSLQPPPGFCRRGDELEHHELGSRRRQGSLRAHRSMTDSGEHALDRV